jgi:membrane protein GlpM
MPMSLILKACIGAAVVLVIGLLSRTRNYYIAGLVPLFPTFALMAHYIIGIERTRAELKETVIFGMWAVVPYLVYLTAVYFFVDRFPLGITLTAATLCWLGLAYLLVYCWGRI